MGSTGGGGRMDTRLFGLAVPSNVPQTNPVPQPETAGPKAGPARGAPLLPVRSSLPAQTAAVVLAEIRRGRWREWLPGERQLSRDLRVSRGTVRTALGILERQEIVTPVSSQGHRIVVRPRQSAARRAKPVIGLLSPEPLEARRPYFAMMLDHLQESAHARGWEFRRYYGASYFGLTAESHLSRLVSDSRCACWILARATRVAQAWFSKRGVPAVVSGHTYEGIALPSIDVDHRGAGRHAGTTLARHGHRTAALVVSRERLPGLLVGEAGFLEGFRDSAGVENVILRVPYDGDDAALTAAVAKALEQPQRPTAVVTETPNQYLTVFSLLAQLRLVVPRDVSLVSRLDDPFLAHLTPEPARYRVSPVGFARALTTLLTHLVNGEKLPVAVREIVPEFIKGASIGPPRSESEPRPDPCPEQPPGLHRGPKWRSAKINPLPS
jgi:DNA-binding LacI/PurR family transcriptional regulator